MEKRDPKNDPKPVQLQPGDTVLVLNHTKGPFNPKYIGNYHVVSIKGNQIKVRPSIGGPTEMKHMKHVKYVHPTDQYIKHVPDYSTLWRKAALRMNPKHITDLIMYGFSVTELIFISYWTSFRSQTWLLLLVCLGKCFSLQLGILISLMILLLQ